ncbi:MAG: dUTP diphosphatase [Clostridia bacterium]
MRQFEKVAKQHIKYNNFNVKLPARATAHSVGYDFYSPIECVIKQNETKLIFTNVKAKFNFNEALILSSTSGMGKKGIILANGIGVVECDYYGNKDNDGNIGFMLHNQLENDYIINIDDKIGQGFFINYLTVDNEKEVITQRVGGFGSTNKTIKNINN